MAEQIYLTLNNGLQMPALGYGTWQASEEEITVAINQALEADYRHIDTAPVYLNEKSIGDVLRKWLSAEKIKRSDIFITTKLPPTANRPDLVEQTLKKSLADLQLDYVDLYLIHTPFTVLAEENGEIKRSDDGTVMMDSSTNHAAVWKEMETLVSKGLAKSIGLSNFNQKQIEKLQPQCVIKPAVLQIEYHIYLQQPDLIKYCKSANIAVTAYAPLGSKGVVALNRMAGIECQVPDLFEVPEVKALAKKYNKTGAQVLLRWILDKGLSAIPKSTNAERIAANRDVFDFALNEEDIEALNKLDANVRVIDLSFLKGIEKHPEYPF